MASPASRPVLQPRLLTQEEAAQYLGNITVRSLKRLRLGVVLLGSTVRYDRLALDAHLDKLAGLAPATPPPSDTKPGANDDDTPEAAFERSAPNI